MYLLLRDYPRQWITTAIWPRIFPAYKNSAAAHWRAGWLSYREGQFDQAARMFDEQIRLYPQDTDSAAAMYWRARLYETQDHKPALAAADYRALMGRYQHYFYAQMSRERLKALGLAGAGEPDADGCVRAAAGTALGGHVSRRQPAYCQGAADRQRGAERVCGQEIAADPDSASWSALAEAQIYASFGETFRAMRR